MGEWAEKRLGDMININPSSLSNSHDGVIQYVDISSVERGRLLGYTEYDFAEAPGRARRIIKPGDTIMSTVRPNLRAYYYVRECPDNTVASTGFAVLRAKKTADKRFIYYLVTENSFVDWLSIIAKGSAYPAVDTNDFKRAKVTVPDLPTQTRIAEILSAYDDAIENNNRRIALLEKAARELYREWFVRFRFPGHEDTRFANGLPEGWEIKPLGDMVNITSSKRSYDSERVDTGVPLYRSKEIIQIENGENITEPLFISEEWFSRIRDKFGAPQENDILITSRGTIGVPFLVDKRVFYFSDGNLTWLQSGKTPQIALFLYLWLKSPTGQGVVLSSTIGTSQKALPIENLKRIKLLMPCNTVLAAFCEKAMPFVTQKRILQTQSQNLARQRDLLLPRLMSGKLEV